MVRLVFVAVVVGSIDFKWISIINFTNFCHSFMWLKWLRPNSTMKHKKNERTNKINENRKNSMATKTIKSKLIQFNAMPLNGAIVVVVVCSDW